MVLEGHPSWGFYGRSAEQTEIERILGSGRWFFCAVSGRRRIGKTTLIQRALQSRDTRWVLYFQVPDSDERGVVQTFQDALEDSGLESDVIEAGAHDFASMAELIETLCSLGWIVVIDEFQYFNRKALAPFASYLQSAVDRLRDTRHGGLFVLGSIHTEMTAILEDRHSPLFNRVTHRIDVGHWDFSTLFEMFDAHDVTDPHHRVFLWSLFEGVPKFYRDAFEQGVLSEKPDHRTKTLQGLFFEGSSPLRDEAANWFLRELRGRYDSLLKLLARKGPCAYRELVDEYGRAGSGGEQQLSAYLQTLIERYRMVEKLLPVFAGDKSRKARYGISDNFLSAWLSALSRNVEIARIRPVEDAIARADRALASHEGFAFEQMIRQLTEECSRKAVGDFKLTDMVRGYWNKADGSDIEIDLVALDEESTTVRFGSCKRNGERHDGDGLKRFNGHVDRFMTSKEGRRLSNWKREMALYSPAFSSSLRSKFASQGYVCQDLNDFATHLGHPPKKLFAANERAFQ